MDAQELRIGNYIQDDKSRILEVDGVKKDDTIGFEIEAWPINGGGIVSLPLKPIPLTEEWLIDFGFEYNVEDDAYQGNRLHIEVRNNDAYFTNDSKKLLRDCFGVWLLYTDSFLLDIKHVHQLQNLYFALTGEELTIK